MDLGGKELGKAIYSRFDNYNPQKCRSILPGAGFAEYIYIYI